MRQFGAIIGDRTEIGCNSVINPGSVIGRDCLIYPSVNFRGVLPHGSMVKLRQDMHQEIDKLRREMLDVRGDVASLRGELKAEIRASTSSVTRQMYVAVLGQMPP